MGWAPHLCSHSCSSPGMGHCWFKKLRGSPTSQHVPWALKQFRPTSFTWLSHFCLLGLITCPRSSMLRTSKQMKQNQRNKSTNNNNNDKERMSIFPEIQLILPCVVTDQTSTSNFSLQITSSLSEIKDLP